MSISGHCVDPPSATPTWPCTTPPTTEPTSSLVIVNIACVDGVLVLADLVPTPPPPSTAGPVITQTNSNVGALVRGTPVYSSAADNVDKAQANNITTMAVIGVVSDVSIAGGAEGGIQVFGIVVATTTEWDAVAGTAGGLVTGTRYYVHPTIAGKLTATYPTTPGLFIKSVGKAISRTELEIDFSIEVRL
jgi:hypothetical protein